MNNSERGTIWKTDQLEEKNELSAVGPESKEVEKVLGRRPRTGTLNVAAVSLRKRNADFSAAYSGNRFRIHFGQNVKTVF